MNIPKININIMFMIRNKKQKQTFGQTKENITAKIVQNTSCLVLVVLPMLCL